MFTETVHICVCIGIVALGMYQCTEALDVCFCYVTSNTWAGTKSTTESGRTCQRWDSQSPHSHSRDDSASFPEYSLSEAADYCRDPDGEGFPWCYTTDPSVRWENCGVPRCENAPENTDTCYVIANTWAGTKSTTQSGRTCQRWDSQSPHSHSRDDPASFPDYSLSEAANYCRDPDGEGFPWCYTTDQSVRWENCGVPTCESNESGCTTTAISSTTSVTSSTSSTTTTSSTSTTTSTTTQTTSETTTVPTSATPQTTSTTPPTRTSTSAAPTTSSATTPTTTSTTTTSPTSTTTTSTTTSTTSTQPTSTTTTLLRTSTTTTPSTLTISQTTSTTTLTTTPTATSTTTSQSTISTTTIPSTNIPPSTPQTTSTSPTTTSTSTISTTLTTTTQTTIPITTTVTAATPTTVSTTASITSSATTAPTSQSQTSPEITSSSTLDVFVDNTSRSSRTPLYIRPCLSCSNSKIKSTITEDILKEFEIESKTTAISSRSKISVQDRRSSSTVMGYMGLAIICAALTFLSSSDFIAVSWFCIRCCASWRLLLRGI